jgi:multidrug efflux system membrane fusion protein
MALTQVYSRCALALIAASTLALAGCGTKARSEAPQLRPVRAVEVGTIQIGGGVRYSANIAAYSQVDLAFKSGGYIAEIRQVRGADGRMRDVGEGDWVAKGTVLAVVRRDDYEHQLAQARAQLARAQAAREQAKLAYDRTSILYSNQAATKPEYDSAKAQNDSTEADVRNAEAGIAQAETALNDCSLRAPFDAWVLKRNVDIGSLVGSATVGFSLADTRHMKAVFGVPDTAIGRVQLADRQTITTDAVPGDFAGRVTAISPAADPRSRVYSVEVTIPNPRNQLRAGMIASLTLNQTEAAHPTLAVPLDAVIRNPDQPNTFAVLAADGAGDTATACLRTVELGEAYGNMITVLKGITPGERVLTSGATYVKNGDKVHIIP